MDQTNAIIDCDVARLNIALRPCFARVGHNFVARIRRVPADCTSVTFRAFKANGSYFDTTAHEHASGEWTVRIIGACFPTVGDFKYEIHAVAGDDEPCALGEGRLRIDAFTTTTTPVTPGTIQTVAQLPTEGGGLVQVVMKWDGFAWVPEAIPVAEVSNDGGNS